MYSGLCGAEDIDILFMWWLIGQPYCDDKEQKLIFNFEEQRLRNLRSLFLCVSYFVVDGGVRMDKFRIKGTFNVT